MPHRAAYLLLPYGKPLPSMTSSTPVLPPPPRRHCATPSSPPLRHAAAAPCRIAVSPGGVLRAAIVGRKRRSSFVPPHRLVAMARRGIAGHRLSRNLASSPSPGGVAGGGCSPSLPDALWYSLCLPPSSSYLFSSRVFSVHGMVFPCPSLCSLSQKFGRGKGGGRQEMGWTLGFPHLHDVGYKNPQTLVSE